MDTRPRQPTTASTHALTVAGSPGTRARRRTLTALILLCLCATLVVAPADDVTRAAVPGTTYYVAPGGSDGNDCLSSGTPCLTIGGALAKTAAGDTVAVGAGTYHERLSVAHDLTITGAGAGATVVDGSGAVTGTLLSVGPSVAATVAALTLQRGHAGEGDGGGVTTGGRLTLADSVVRDNTGGAAGGIYQYGGTMTLTRSVVDGNSGDVGGVDTSYGALTLISSTVSGNSGGTGGIGVDNATLTLTSSTVGGNDGTGIQNGGATTLINSTVSANIGIGLDNLVSAALYNSTVGGNSKVGVFSEGSGLVTLAGTIVGDNIGPDCSGPLTSQGYNLLGSAAGCAGLREGVDGDRVGVDPRLGPLQDNGGPTMTQAPGPGSPAIDGGNPAGCTDNSGRPLTADGRGGSRPDAVNNRCDIGAVEIQAPPSGAAAPLPGAPPPGDTPTASAAPPSAVATVTTTASRVLPHATPATPATPRPRATAVRPPPPSLTLHPGASAVASGDTLVIRLTTVARARVHITLQATATAEVMSGSGKNRRRTTRRVVLYQATLNGTADARGGYEGRLRIGYRPAKPVRAALVATARTARGESTRTATVTIEPPRPRRRT